MRLLVLPAQGHTIQEGEHDHKDIGEVVENKVLLQEVGLMPLSKRI